MRHFSVVLESPRSCDCCGTSLAALDSGLSRDKFRLEFCEGSELSFGHGFRLSTAGGKMKVALRQKRCSASAWALRPNFNNEAFARAKAERPDDKLEAGYTWYIFTFDLPVFKPTISSWWAELQFVEVDPFKKGFSGQPLESHNASTVRVKLDTLE